MMKKGQFDVARKTLYWTIATVIITFILLGFVYVIGGYQGKIVQVPDEVRAKIVSLRFASNPSCFAYENEVTGRVQMNSVDLSKFTQENMELCYKTDEKSGHRDLNFELELKKSGKRVKTNNYFQVPHFQIIQPVLVWSGEMFEQDFLIINVQRSLPYRLSYEGK